MTLSDKSIAAIIAAEEVRAIGYPGGHDSSEVQYNRKVLLDYYNQKKYGDEVEGMSTIVTSDVADMVNSVQPELVRRFTQGKYIAKFRCEDENESSEKTEYANYVLTGENDPVKILGSMFFDGNLQYTGVVKVTWSEEQTSEENHYENLTDLDLIRLQLDPNLEITSIEKDEETDLFDVSTKKILSNGKTVIENIPPDELLVADRARDFSDPPFIGQRTPKTRSELIEMGIPKKVVESLPVDAEVDNQVKTARNEDVQIYIEENPTSDASKDIIYLGEYYIKMDVDEDGISELWQVLWAGGKVLEKTRVDDNPYCVYVPIPIPHRAVGTCIAEQVADKQYWKSTLVRQANNNIYATNFNRVIANQRVNLDDLLTPRHGGVVRVKDNGPIGDAVTPMPVQSQVPAILQMIDYVDSSIEKQTGVTSYNQGVDTESLNKTATGFRGIRDMSQMRIELMARIAANGSIKRMFEKIIKLAKIHVEDSINLRTGGQGVSINPSQWSSEDECIIDIGLGSGDRQEKIANLSLIYQEQKELKTNGSALVDDQKMYNTLDKVTTEVGLKGAASYFNDPSQPEDAILAENEQLKATIDQLSQQLQAVAPLLEAEKIKAEVKLQETMMKEQNKAEIEIAKLQQKDRHHDDDVSIKLTEIEAENKVDVPGALI